MTGLVHILLCPKPCPLTYSDQCTLSTWKKHTNTWGRHNDAVVSLSGKSHSFKASVTWRLFCDKPTAKAAKPWLEDVSLATSRALTRMFPGWPAEPWLEDVSTATSRALAGRRFHGNQQSPGWKTFPWRPTVKAAKMFPQQPADPGWKIFPRWPTC